MLIFIGVRFPLHPSIFSHLGFLHGCYYYSVGVQLDCCQNIEHLSLSMFSLQMLRCFVRLAEYVYMFWENCWHFGFSSRGAFWFWFACCVPDLPLFKRGRSPSHNKTWWTRIGVTSLLNPSLLFCSLHFSFQSPSLLSISHLSAQTAFML